MPFMENKYLKSVMEGIDLLLADVKQNNALAQRREEMNAKTLQRRNEQNTQRKFGLLSGIATSKETFSPETQQQATQSIFKLLENPDTDISNLKVEPYQKPAGEQREVSEFTHEYFPQTKGKMYPYDTAEWFDNQARMMQEAKRNRAAGGKGKDKGDPVMNRLDDYLDSAQKILHQGFQEEGFAGKVGLSPEVVSQFINVVDDLKRKKESGKWTKEDQATYNALKPLEVSGLRGQKVVEDLRNIMLNASERMRKLREE